VTNKERGRYYTPANLARWITQRVLHVRQQTGDIHILEPSCGDGVFFRALTECGNQQDLRVEGVEIESEALRIAQNSYPSATLFNDDFLLWENPHEYDIIIGNPPYISKKTLLPAKQQSARTFISKPAWQIERSQIFGLLL